MLAGAGAVLLRTKSRTPCGIDLCAESCLHVQCGGPCQLHKACVGAHHAAHACACTCSAAVGEPVSFPITAAAVAEPSTTGCDLTVTTGPLALGPTATALPARGRVTSASHAAAAVACSSLAAAANFGPLSLTAATIPLTWRAGATVACSTLTVAAFPRTSLVCGSQPPSTLAFPSQPTAAQSGARLAAAT